MKLISTVAALILVIQALAVPETDQKAQIRVLRDISGIRRNYAKSHNNANMHELRQDISMFALAELIAKSCPTSDELQKIEVYEFIPMLRNVNGKCKWKGHDQSRIRKILLESRPNLSDNFTPQCRKVNLIHVLGPENRKIIKHGVPGTQCKENYVAKDGPCVKTT